MMSDKTRGIAPDTMSDYLASMNKWTRAWLRRPSKSITKAEIKSLLFEMNEGGISKSFQQKTKGVIHRIFLWGIEEGCLKDMTHSPAHGIKVSRKSEKKPSILNTDEIRRLLRVAKRGDHPWYPIWAVALLTGCRNGELYALTWDDVDFSSMTIRVSKSFNKRQRVIKSTKAGYWQTIPINSDLANLIKELKLKSNGRPEILPRLRDWSHGYQAKVIKVFCEGIGITPICFHDLRACFATQLLQNKVAPATVMKICGWKDLDTMARYIRLAGIDEAGATDCLAFTPTEAREMIIKLDDYRS